MDVFKVKCLYFEVVFFNEHDMIYFWVLFRSPGVADLAFRTPLKFGKLVYTVPIATIAGLLGRNVINYDHITCNTELMVLATHRGQFRV